MGESDGGAFLRWRFSLYPIQPCVRQQHRQACGPPPARPARRGGGPLMRVRGKRIVIASVAGATFSSV